MTIRQTHCSDQPDKSYAISGLASDICVQPVYSEKTVDELYFDIACRLLSLYGLAHVPGFTAHPHSSAVSTEVIEPLRGT